MIEGRNYSDSKIVTEDSLKVKKDRPIKSHPALLGTVRKRRPRETTRRMRRGHRDKYLEVPIYLVESKKPNDKIRNLIQTSASILNNSRALFYDQIVDLANICSPEKFELAYTDTGRSTRLFACLFQYYFFDPQTLWPLSHLPPTWRTL